jgi:hypothetical protein
VPENVGLLYRSAICSWFDEARSYQGGVLRDVRFVLATTPSIYKDFGLDKLECDAARGVALWEIHSPMDGSPPASWLRGQSPASASSGTDMCATGDECIFDRYTAYGSAFTAGRSPIYLDRFRGNECALEDLQTKLSQSDEDMLRQKIANGGL